MIHTTCTVILLDFNYYTNSFFSQVYVFDFGSELYLWQGKAATPNQRKVSLRLAQQLWTQEYDYSKCEVNPLSPLKSKHLTPIILVEWSCYEFRSV